MMRLEALAMAIANQYDAFDPSSEAFSTLNPGMLRSYSIDHLQPVNENGTRVFQTFHSGWMALISNLQAKCHGKTRATGNNGKLSPDSCLLELVRTFRYVQVRKVIENLQDALDDKAIGETTPLRFFVEEHYGN